MNLIDEGWKRVLTSVFLGILFSRTIGSLTNHKVKIQAFVFSIILYFVLTRINKRRQSEKENQNK
jgi:hypothetical protein